MERTETCFEVVIVGILHLIVTMVEAYDSDKKVANIAVVIIAPNLLILGFMMSLFMALGIPETP